MKDYTETVLEYRAMKYWRDEEGYVREGIHTLCIANSDYDVIKSFHDEALDELGAQLKAKAFIDGYLLGLERGKEIGADNLRHDLRRLINVGATL